MLQITAPEQVTGRVGSIWFVDGVAEVGAVSAAERLFLSTRGYRIEDSSGPSDTEGAETKADLLAAIAAATS